MYEQKWKIVDLVLSFLFSSCVVTDQLQYYRATTRGQWSQTCATERSVNNFLYGHSAETPSDSDPKKKKKKRDDDPDRKKKKKDKKKKKVS